MPVIWGLDLREIQLWKFKSSYMFNTEYYLRREKMIVYQIAMIFCVCSESVGTAALSEYVDQQDFVERMNNKALVYNDDFVGIASYNIFVGIYVATIFGSGFFFDLFWPERYESPSIRFAWKVCSILAVVFCLGAALGLTIIVATKHAYITGIGSELATELLKQSSKNPSLIYRHNAKAIASTVLLWIGLVGTVGSCFLMFKSHFHDDKMINHLSNPEAEQQKRSGRLQKRKTPTSA